MSDGILLELRLTARWELSMLLLLQLHLLLLRHLQPVLVLLLLVFLLLLLLLLLHLQLLLQLQNFQLRLQPLLLFLLLLQLLDSCLQRLWGMATAPTWLPLQGHLSSCLQALQVSLPYPLCAGRALLLLLRLALVLVLVLLPCPSAGGPFPGLFSARRVRATFPCPRVLPASPACCSGQPSFVQTQVLLCLALLPVLLLLSGLVLLLFLALLHVLFPLRLLDGEVLELLLQRRPPGQLPRKQAFEPRCVSWLPGAAAAKAAAAALRAGAAGAAAAPLPLFVFLLFAFLDKEALRLPLCPSCRLLVLVELRALRLLVLASCVLVGLPTLALHFFAALFSLKAFLFSLPGPHFPACLAAGFFFASFSTASSLSSHSSMARGSPGPRGPQKQHL